MQRRHAHAKVVAVPCEASQAACVGERAARAARRVHGRRRRRRLAAGDAGAAIGGARALTGAVEEELLAVRALPRHRRFYMGARYFLIGLRVGHSQK